MKKILFISFILFLIEEVKSQPSNDNCSGAINIPLVVGQIASPSCCMDVAGATQSNTSVSCSQLPSTTTFDVYYKFTAVSPNVEIVVTPSSGFDPAIQLLSGGCSSLTEVVCADNGGGSGYTETLMYNNLTVGNTYRFRVYDYGANPPTTTSFNLTVYSAASNSGSSQISFSPSSLNFGSVPISAGAVNLGLSVTNNGNANLNINNINYPNGFSGPSSLTVSDGNTENISIEFDPSNNNNYSGSVTFYSNASSSPHHVNVNGTGTTNPVAVLNITPTNLNFGTLTQGGNSSSQAITISNPGTAALSISSITPPNNFTLNWTNGSIPAGGSQIVTVTFNPSNTGNFTGNITVNSAVGNQQIGVQAIVAQNSNFVSGNVKNAVSTISSGTGLIVQNIGSGHSVKLYSGNTLLSQTTTNSSGSFSFSNISNSSNLKLNITIGQLNIWKTNVLLGSNYSITAPKGLMDKIDALKNDLAQIEFDLGFLGTGTVTGYNVSGLNTLINSTPPLGYRSITNNFDDVNEILGRLNNAATTLNEIVKDASENSAKTTDVISDLFEMATSFFKITNLIKRNTNNIIIDGAVNALNQLVLFSIDTLIDLALAVVDPYERHTATQAISFFKNYLFAFLENDLDAFIYSALEEIVKLESNRIILRGYRNNTQFLLNNSIQECSNPANPFSITLPASKQIALNSINISLVETQNNVNNIHTVLSASQVLGIVTEAIGIIQPLSPQVFTPLRNAIIALRVGALGLGLKYGFTHQKRLRMITTNSIGSQLSRPSIQLTPFNQNVVANLNQSFINANDDYINYIDSLYNDVLYSKDYALMEKISRLPIYNQSLDTSLTNALYPIEAVAEQAFNADPNFESTYFNDFVDVIGNSHTNRIEMSFALFDYLLDTTSNAANSSLLNSLNNVKQLQQNLPIPLQQFDFYTTQYQAPAYPVVYGIDGSRQALYNTTTTTNIRFGNEGAVDMSGVYLKLTPVGGATISTDSIYIGNLLAGQRTNRTIQVTAPNQDTVSGFVLDLVDVNGLAIGGAFLQKATNELYNPTRLIPIVQAIELSPSPNPAATEIMFQLSECLISKVQELEISVYDMQGKKVAINDYSIIDNQLTIQTSDMQNGQYSIQLKSPKCSATTIIIINH